MFEFIAGYATGMVVTFLALAFFYGAGKSN